MAQSADQRSSTWSPNLDLDALRTKAEAGDAEAQYHLGMMFARGDGAPRDEAAAAEWLRQAAEGGHAEAQYNLGVRCHRASVDPRHDGAKESRVEAYKWFCLAAAQDYRDSQTACQRVRLMMTTPEITEGNRLAAAFAVRKQAIPQPA